MIGCFSLIFECWRTKTWQKIRSLSLTVNNIVMTEGVPSELIPATMIQHIFQGLNRPGSQSHCCIIQVTAATVDP